MRLRIPFALGLPVVVLGAVLFLPARGEQRIADHDFIGADRCRTCHPSEYAAWERSPHARAFQTLSPKDQKDPRCQACHTMVPADLGAGLLGVQCESCHGAGRYYSVEWVMRDAELRAQVSFDAGSPAACARCHTDSSPSLSPFVLEDKLRLIQHWPDRPAKAKP